MLNLLRAFFLITLFSASIQADNHHIWMQHSNDGKALYINISPIYYTARQKGFSPIEMPSNILPKKLSSRPLSLTIFGLCDSASPKEREIPGHFSPQTQIIETSFTITPLPNDKKAVLTLSWKGLFREFQQMIRGGPYFIEKGGGITIKDYTWPVIIKRYDVAFYSTEQDYTVRFSNPSDGHLFMHVLKSSAVPIGTKKIPQIEVLLKSPSFHISAVYALERGSNDEWDKKIKDRWNKILSWCPREK